MRDKGGLIIGSYRGCGAFAMPLPKCVQVVAIVATIVASGVCGAGDVDELLWGSGNFVPPFSDAEKDVKTITAADIASRYGYPFESHEVTTDDGYILSLHRIPSNRQGDNGSGPPVLLFHGLLGCSADWLVQGPERSLGFLLADRGYDVWLGNARGTTESKRHVSLNSTDRVYWNFSWHEIGYYDLPAKIDYILEMTQRKSLSYVGFSQGTTIFWVLGSERSDYIAKVNKMFALAPVAYFQRVENGLFKSVASLATNMEWVVNMIGTGEFLPTSTFMAWAAKTFCRDDVWTHELCKNVVFLFFGFSKHMNMSLLPTIFGYDPAGAATKQILHYAQLVREAPSFRLYDYGWLANLYKYGAMKPPIYELHKISCPVRVYVGPADWMANELDVRRLYGRFKNPGGFQVVKRADFNHIDFTFGMDARQLIYDDLIEILEAGDDGDGDDFDNDVDDGAIVGSSQ